MGGDVGPAETSRRSPTPEVPPEDAPTGEPSARSPIGAGGTPYTAGPDARQPEIAQGPAEGISREEDAERPGTTRSPIVSIDPDPGAAERTGAARRDRGSRPQRDEPMDDTTEEE